MPDDDVPLSIEPVVGWRAWQLVRQGSELRLGSLVHGGTWTPQAVEAATCGAYPHPRDHDAPQRHCTCGYYATDSWRSLCDARVLNDNVGVIGAIGQWGTVIEHMSGARSQFAYPARVRLVCGPCIKAKVVRDPVTVVEQGGGRLSPRCAKHAGRANGVPAKAIEWELLNTYRVELLPQPSIPRHVRWGISWEKGVSKPAQVGIWMLSAIFMAVRFVISLVFTLWLIGIALAIIGAVFGAIAGALGLVDDPAPTPSAVVQDQADATILHLGAYLDRTQRERYAGIEPHRGAPRPPRVAPIALTCGIGRGDHVEFVRCSIPGVDLFGFAQQRDPRGVAEDCVPPTDAYSSGPHWYECWFAPAASWIAPNPTSPNPFVHPLGGAADGDR